MIVNFIKNSKVITKLLKKKYFDEKPYIINKATFKVFKFTILRSLNYRMFY